MTVPLQPFPPSSSRPVPSRQMTMPLPGSPPRDDKLSIPSIRRRGSNEEMGELRLMIPHIECGEPGKGASASPLDQLRGRALRGSIAPLSPTGWQSGLPSHVRPPKPLAGVVPTTSSSSPLVFHNFRRSRASSLDSTRYTDSIYTDLGGIGGEDEEEDEELRAWFEGRHRIVVPGEGKFVGRDEGWGNRKEEIRDWGNDDETRTESGSTEGESSADEGDGGTALEQHGQQAHSQIPLNSSPSRSPEAYRRRRHDSRQSSSPSFTTSSRLSHFLDISASKSFDYAKDQVEADQLEKEAATAPEPLSMPFTDSPLSYRSSGPTPIYASGSATGANASIACSTRLSPASAGIARLHPPPVSPTASTSTSSIPPSSSAMPSSASTASYTSARPVKLGRGASLRRGTDNEIANREEVRVAVESMYGDEGLSWDWSPEDVAAAVDVEAKVMVAIREGKEGGLGVTGAEGMLGGPVKTVVGVKNFSRPVNPNSHQQWTSTSPSSTSSIPLAPMPPPPAPPLIIETKPSMVFATQPTTSLLPSPTLSRPSIPWAQSSTPPSMFAAPPLKNASSRSPTYAYSATPLPGQIFVANLPSSQDPNTIFTPPRPAFAGRAISSSRKGKDQSFPPSSLRPASNLSASTSNLPPAPNSLPTRRAPAPPLHQCAYDGPSLSLQLPVQTQAIHSSQSHVLLHAPTHSSFSTSASSSPSSPLRGALHLSPASSSASTPIHFTSTAHRNRIQTSPETRPAQLPPQLKVNAPLPLSSSSNQMQFPTTPSSTLTPRPFEGRQRFHSSTGASSISSSAAVRNLPLVSSPIPVPPHPTRSMLRPTVDTSGLPSLTSNRSRSATSSPVQQTSPVAHSPPVSAPKKIPIVPSLDIEHTSRPVVGRSTSNGSAAFSFYELLEPSSGSSSPSAGYLASSGTASFSASTPSIRGTYHKVDLNAPSPLSQLALTASSISPSSPPNALPISPSNSSISPFNPSTPSHHLALGISAHGSGRLPLAAHHFQLAATLAGGCPGGKLFWGLTLRSGWGIERDESKGFEWLRLACEEAASAAGRGGDAEGAIGSGGGAAAIRPEVVVAIFETAQCFLRGWGVTKDIIKAYSYFLIAARLSDLDAQLALASCYLHGVGCPNGKKDRHAAAYWYRRAIEQGASSNGLGWVYKKKYASYQGA